MLNKFTIIGIIIGSAISILGASSMVTSLNSPNEIQEDTATFGVGDFDKINFNAPANSSQSLIITGDSFDVKITTPDSSNDVKSSFKNKANFSWTSITAGQTIGGTTYTTGTVDTNTGGAVADLVLKAPSNSTVVTPVTTLVAETGLSESAVKEVLGLPAEMDVLNFNPFAENLSEADKTVALAAEKINRLDFLEEHLKYLIRLNPRHAQAYNALGYTLADRTDRFSEALKYIEIALSLEPEDPYILDSMGWVCFKMRKLECGKKYLKMAYETRPDPEIAAHLGELLWFQGDEKAAEKLWTDALNVNPSSEELQFLLRKYLDRK